MGTACLLVLGMAAAAMAWKNDSQFGFSRLLALGFEWSVRAEAYTVPGLAVPAKPWPTNQHTPTLKAAGIRDASEFYRTTNIWLTHLKFSRDEWETVQPKRIAPLPDYFQPDGSFLLRNTNAQPSCCCRAWWSDGLPRAVVRGGMATWRWPSLRAMPSDNSCH